MPDPDEPGGTTADEAGEWCPDGIYRTLCDELLCDPLPEPAPADPAGRPDGSWCEDRDPTELTDADGIE
ncbi:MAG: hypothetical protein L0K86_06315 [Actinomycetia bacterium]|nr:hypothetical protein [Actinomycetes bacterium]